MQLDSNYLEHSKFNGFLYLYHPLSFLMSFDSLRKVNISSCKSTHFARNLFLFHKTSIDISLDFGTQFPSLSRSPNSKQKSTPTVFFSLYFWLKVYLTLSTGALILTERHYTFCKEPTILAESHFFPGARTSGEQCAVKALPPSSTCSSSLSPRQSLLKTSPSPRQLSKPDLTNISSIFFGLSCPYFDIQSVPSESKVGSVGPNFSKNVTWERLIILSLSQKRPNNIFPDIGGVSYS